MVCANASGNGSGKGPDGTEIPARLTSTPPGSVAPRSSPFSANWEGCANGGTCDWVSCRLHFVPPAPGSSVAALRPPAWPASHLAFQWGTTTRWVAPPRQQSRLGVMATGMFQPRSSLELFGRSSLCAALHRRCLGTARATGIAWNHGGGPTRFRSDPPTEGPQPEGKENRERLRTARRSRGAELAREFLRLDPASNSQSRRAPRGTSDREWTRSRGSVISSNWRALTPRATHAVGRELAQWGERRAA